MGKLRNGIFKTAALSVAASLMACAPQVEKREFAPARRSFETRQVDTDLNLETEVTSQASPLASRLTWAADDVNSAELLRAAERMLRVGRRLNKPGLEASGERLAQIFYRSSGTTTRVQFEDSLYVKAAVGETEADTLRYLDKTRAMLIEDRNVINLILESSKTHFDWPQGRMDVESVVGAVDRYLGWWISRIEAMGVDKRVVDSIRTAAKKEFDIQMPRIRGAYAKVKGAQTMTQAVQEIKAFAKVMEFEIGPKSQAEIDKGAKVGALLDALKTPQDALSMIIDFWIMLTPEERQASLGVVSKDLYDFLNNASEEDLKCLKRAGCNLFGNFFLLLKKHLGVLPQIEEFGVEKLRLQMDEASRDFLVAQLESQVGAYLPELPNIVRESVDKEFDAILVWVAGVRRDLPAFVRGVTARWAQDQLTRDGRELVGIEAARANVRMKATGLEVSGNARAFETGGEILGASLSLAAERLLRHDTLAEAKTPANMRLAIAQINKLLAIGGFRGPEKKMSRAYAIALDPQAPPGSTVNLRSFLDAPFSYAVLDKFKLNGAFDAVLPQAKERGVSVKSQAELLRGYAGMIRYFRDWEISGFDHALGRVTLGAYVDGPAAGAIDDKLFPKDMMFAVALGNAAVVLQNMTKTMTPVFVMDLEGNFSWSNEFDSSKGNSSTMAGLVDMIGGVRQNLVRTEDVARFGIALLEFIDAIEGVRNTQAAPLIEGVEPNRPVDELTKQLPELKNLVVGISNFLARKMQADDGGLHAIFDRTRNEYMGGRRLIDQALAIQMLARASQVLDVKAYGTAALDAYFYMNRRLWKPGLRFYMREENVTDAPTPDEALTALEAVEDLTPFMSDFSKAQWENISRPWIGALERF